jgi:hypothetical protein
MDGLKLFLDDGSVEMDSNIVERAIRPTALNRIAITRMRDHEATKSYVIKRTAQGKSKREITRCLKRYIVREFYRELCMPKNAKAAP